MQTTEQTPRHPNSRQLLHRTLCIQWRMQGVGLYAIWQRFSQPLDPLGGICVRQGGVCAVQESVQQPCWVKAAHAYKYLAHG